MERKTIEQLKAEAEFYYSDNFGVRTLHPSDVKQAYIDGYEDNIQAMHQFSEQVACGFAEWLANNCEPVHVNTIFGGKWHYLLDQTIKTTSDLFNGPYQEYLKQQSK